MSRILTAAGRASTVEASPGSSSTAGTPGTVKIPVIGVLILQGSEAPYPLKVKAQ